MAVMRKNPEEIKKGLECCKPHSDALALIRQLEADIKILKIEKEEIIELAYRLERERDAAVFDLTESKYCQACKHREEKEELDAHYDVPAQCVNCTLEKSQFLWRGPCEENRGKPEPPKEEERKAAEWEK